MATKNTSSTPPNQPQAQISQPSNMPHFQSPEPVSQPDSFFTEISSQNDPHARSPSQERAQRIRIKNRRKLYLDRHPSYFASPDLELAGMSPICFHTAIESRDRSLTKTQIHYSTTAVSDASNPLLSEKPMVEQKATAASSKQTCIVQKPKLPPYAQNLRLRLHHHLGLNLRMKRQQDSCPL